MGADLRDLVASGSLSDRVLDPRAALSHDSEPGFFVVGMQSYGRAPTFLITTGDEQVRSIVAHLARAETAADEVQLVLLGTGVCSSNNALSDEEVAAGEQASAAAATPRPRRLQRCRQWPPRWNGCGSGSPPACPTAAPPTPTRRRWSWRTVAVLAVAETVSWGSLDYAYAVFRVPMDVELGASPAVLAGAFSLAVPVDRG